MQVAVIETKNGMRWLVPVTDTSGISKQLMSNGGQILEIV